MKEERIKFSFILYFALTMCMDEVHWHMLLIFIIKMIPQIFQSHLLSLVLQHHLLQTLRNRDADEENCICVNCKKEKASKNLYE